MRLIQDIYNLIHIDTLRRYITPAKYAGFGYPQTGAKNKEQNASFRIVRDHLFKRSHFVNRQTLNLFPLHFRQTRIRVRHCFRCFISALRRCLGVLFNHAPTRASVLVCLVHGSIRMISA
jgi:hypothetical protein